MITAEELKELDKGPNEYELLFKLVHSRRESEYSKLKRLQRWVNELVALFEQNDHLAEEHKDALEHAKGRD